MKLITNEKLKFQFPSNGKSYPKVFDSNTLSDIENKCVSIPFKREIISKVCLTNIASGTRNTVSIPFKREIISKVHHWNGIPQGQH